MYVRAHQHICAQATEKKSAKADVVSGTRLSNSARLSSRALAAEDGKAVVSGSGSGGGGGGGGDMASLLMPSSVFDSPSVRGSDDGGSHGLGDSKKRVVPSVVVTGGIGGTISRSPPSGGSGVGVHHRSGAHNR